MHGVELTLRQKIVGCVFVAVLLCAVPAFAGPFEGSFASNGVQLILRESGAAADGEAIIDGKSHPVKAQISGQTIQGQYLFEGSWVPFQGALAGTVLTLTSEGEIYRLTKAVAAKTQAGPPPTGGLQNDGWGISLEAPATWTGGQQDGGFAFGSTKLTGLILVFPHEATTFAELREGAAEGLEADSGKLSLVGDPQTFGTNGVSAELKGALDGKAARGYAVGVLNPEGSGAVVLAVVEEASYTPDHAKAAEAIAKSIQFYKPPVPDAVTSWERDLAGSKLEYIHYYRSTGFSGGGSTSSNIVITLCGDRSFWYRNRSHTSIDVGAVSGHAASKGGSGGTWSVAMGNVPTLVLKYEDGRTENYQLVYEKKKLYLGGDRYYWSKANCGG